MKNIHILPTDKPSRLFDDGIEFYLGELKDRKGHPVTNYHLFITSDEEIKVNDYIADGYKVWQWKDDSSLLGRKKVILTTDQDLIKDGVQATLNEFLEWFVKNPSCEYIKIENVYDKFLNGDKRSVSDFRKKYKIIIPKEEPKQDLREYPLTPDECFKQETLEEAAESFFNNTRFRNYKTFFCEGAKWQQERSYSEEDLISLLEFNYKKETNQLGTLRKDYSQKIVRKWFEEFKKK